MTLGCVFLDLSDPRPRKKGDLLSTFNFNFISKFNPKKMRFHYESAFGKSWFEYYAANNLERLSYDERLKVYYNFSATWTAK